MLDLDVDNQFDLPRDLSVRHMQSVSHRFLKTARVSNGFYFLLTIFGKSSDINLLKYQATANKVLQDAVISKICEHGNATVSCRDAAFVVLSYYESMTMLLLFRQLSDICIGEEFMQFPWIKGEVNIYKNAQGVVSFNKRKIVSRMIDELDVVDGAADFCRCLSTIYSQECIAIRNAIAHGTYRQPTEEDPDWEFGILRLKGGNMRVSHIRVSAEEMGEFLRSIVSFRIGFLRALERYKSALNSRKVRMSGITLTPAKEHYEIEFDKGQITYLNSCTPISRDSRFE